MLEDMECYVAIPMCNRTAGRWYFPVSHLCFFFLQVYINSAASIWSFSKSRVPWTAGLIGKWQGGVPPSAAAGHSAANPGREEVEGTHIERCMTKPPVVATHHLFLKKKHHPEIWGNSFCHFDLRIFFQIGWFSHQLLMNLNKPSSQVANPFIAVAYEIIATAGKAPLLQSSSISQWQSQDWMAVNENKLPFFWTILMLLLFFTMICGGRSHVEFFRNANMSLSFRHRKKKRSFNDGLMCRCRKLFFERNLCGSWRCKDRFKERWGGEMATSNL